MHKSVCLKPFLSQESKFPLLLLMHSQFDFCALSSLFYCYWQQGSFKESVFCSVSHHLFYKFLGWSWKRWWTADTLRASGKKLVHFQLDFSLNFIFPPPLFACLHFPFSTKFWLIIITKLRDDVFLCLGSEQSNAFMGEKNNILTTTVPFVPEAAMLLNTYL